MSPKTNNANKSTKLIFEQDFFKKKKEIEAKHRKIQEIMAAAKNKNK